MWGQLLVGVAGVVVGAVLGGSTTYFRLRRDAWTAARASGLLMLAEVRGLHSALRDASSSDPVVAGTSVAVKGWESHGETLAHFRRGNFPNGFRAPEWLELASCFAQLERFQAAPRTSRDIDWLKDVNSELVEAEQLLTGFKDDPPVFGYVIKTGLRKYLRAARNARRRLVRRLETKAPS